MSALSEELAKSVGESNSQGTVIEQSRAVAEVQSMVVLARNNPRNQHVAVSEIERSCGMEIFVKKCFYRFPRGGQNVTGASIFFAQEMARCWKNILYGITELDRNDEKGFSEMKAYAWDLESNTRRETTFIVPHVRYTKGRSVALKDPRDIYENNANMGARRLREMIFSVLPEWYVENAKEAAQNTIEQGTKGESVQESIAKCIKAFEAFGVTLDQIEAKMKRKTDQMVGHDLAQLRVIFQAIRSGEVSVEEEFPRDDTKELEQKLLAKNDQGSEL